MKSQRDLALSCHRAAMLIGGSALWAQGELTRSGKKEEIMNYLKTLTWL